VNLENVARELADLLSTVPGVRGYPCRVSNYASSTDGTVAAMVVPGPDFVDYYQAMSGGLAVLNWVIQVRVPAVAEEQAQMRLLRLLSAGVGEPESIYDTVKPLDLPQSLNGAIDDLKLGAARVGPADEHPDTPYVGADIDVEMLVTRRHT
jgi:hypothetical protein